MRRIFRIFKIIIITAIITEIVLYGFYAFLTRGDFFIAVVIAIATFFTFSSAFAFGNSNFVMTAMISFLVGCISFAVLIIFISLSLLAGIGLTVVAMISLFVTSTVMVIAMAIPSITTAILTSRFTFIITSIAEKSDAMKIKDWPCPPGAF